MNESQHERWRTQFLRDARTLQPHKQAALRELADTVGMNHATRVRQRLSHGVPMSIVRDEWMEVVTILNKHLADEEKGA